MNFDEVDIVLNEEPDARPARQGSQISLDTLFPTSTHGKVLETSIVVPHKTAREWQARFARARATSHMPHLRFFTDDHIPRKYALPIQSMQIVASGESGNVNVVLTVLNTEPPVDMS